MAAPYRIVIADDHPLFREALKLTLEERTDLRVIGEAGDGLELLNLLKGNQPLPHLAIVDVRMPGLGGFETARQIKEIYPNMKVLILTMFDDSEHLHNAISAGADGYLLKREANQELFPAIEKIQQGKPYVSPLLPWTWP